jgi:hypothetical protein
MSNYQWPRTYTHIQGLFFKGIESLHFAAVLFSENRWVHCSGANHADVWGRNPSKTGK